MLFIKPIEKIAYSDVIEFCNQQYRENINLDYKRNIDASLVKTIAAMANTWGGIILIGVEDEDSKPKLPAIGIPYKEHLREQINNLILGNITPPVFPETKVSISDDRQYVFIIVRVPQSNITPHGIKKNTKVYIRTDTSNEPEELADINRILWLIDKRKNSHELKETFYKRSSERFNTLCSRAGSSIEHTEAIISICPLYPFEILIDYRKLLHEIPQKIRTNGWGHTFPLYSMSHNEINPTHEGTYIFHKNDFTKFIFYEEFNHYGLFYHREDLGDSKEFDAGKIEKFSLLYNILIKVDMFLDAMTRYYEELGYWGLLDFRISLNKLDDVAFKDLPVPHGYFRFEDISAFPLDKRLEFHKELSFQQLKQERIQLVVDLVREISWALGFSHIKSEAIELLMKENNRLR